MATAAEIFADEGKLTFMMTLSSAAMRLRATDTHPRDHVNMVEIAKSGVNAPTVAYESDAWKVATSHLTLLEAADMPSLKPVKSGDKDFPGTGLESGLYTNLNGAALMARSDDALFVAFRGSNDIDGGIGSSPDSEQWGDKRSDHYKLFAKLDGAIKGYLKDHPEVTKVYITGHSLGGGMVNAWMQSHKGSIYEGVSFGSIRYGKGASQPDARTTNVWNDGDIALALGGRADGDSIHFKVAGPDNVSQHMPWLYQAEIQFVHDLGYELNDLTAYNRVVFAASATGLFSSAIGRGYDNLTGSGYRDLILGGANSDRMQGMGGGDDIDGGRGGRDVAVYTEKTAGIDVTLDRSAWVNVSVGGRVEDHIRNIEGIAGGGAADAIVGDDTNNQLAGNGGADSIDGGAANDSIWGGFGRDTLTGGTGFDTFVFDVTPKWGNADLITDFAPNRDVIELDGNVFRGIGATLQVKEFFAGDGATAAHDKTDRIIYDTAGGRLFYDEDGSKHKHDAVLIATLEGAPAIGVHDIHIV